MKSSLLSNLKTVKSGAALIGIAAMLSLSACGTGSAPVDSMTGTPTSEPAISAPATPSPDVSSESTASPEASEDSGLKFTITYNRPDAGTKTSVGEPVEDAEARYLEKALTYSNDETSSELLDMGYATCGFMLGSNTETELFDKISEEYGTGDTEVVAIQASGTASKTLCPEFADFG